MILYKNTGKGAMEHQGGAFDDLNQFFS